VGDLDDYPGEGSLDELYDSDRLSHQLVNQAILGPGAEWPGRGRAAGRHGDRIAGSQHEGAAADVGWPQRGEDLVRVRPVAVSGAACCGDKSGQWTRWYRTAIPQAERLYEDYLAEREKEMGR
jgi:hypothetical protein